MKFAQKLSAVAGLALVVGAAVASPQETFNVGNLVSNGPINNAANGVYNFTSVGGYSLQKILYSGGITQSNTGTFLTEARFQLTPPGGNPTILIQPFTSGTTWTGTRNVSGSLFVTPNYNPAGSWVLKGYESFDDGGTSSVDANWSNLVFVFDNQAIVPPSGTGTYTPNSGLVGTTTVAAVTVTPGTNPVASVTLDASGLGAGSITLRDNGVAPDATAGDNIWSANVNVASGTGNVSTPFTILDNVGTSGSGSMTFTVTLPPPANDDCGTAATAVLGSNPFNNSSATNDGLTACTTSAKDVWFKYTTGANTNDLTFSTCTGTAQDTVVSVYGSCGGTALACNDDSCGLQSSVTVTGIAANTTYYIRVAGFGATPAGGAGVLTIAQYVPPAPAQWEEQANGGGDAGDTIATAQRPTGTNPFVSIGGTFNTDDVDIYKIRICDSTFSITTNTTVTATQDTQLFLFDTAGAGVIMNDDTTGNTTGLRSTLDNTLGTPVGTYYLAVTRWDRDPVNAGGFPIWEDTPFAAVRAPDGLTNGGDITLAGWTGTYTATNVAYQLSMTGVCFAGCAADFNADTIVDFFDYLDFVAAFSSNDPTADFNNDTVIDFFDYLDFVAAFSQGC